jgi:hypothetical protein
MRDLEHMYGMCTITATMRASVPKLPKVLAKCLWPLSALAEAKRGFHVRDEPPIMTTETQGEGPPSVLYGGVPD